VTLFKVSTFLTVSPRDVTLGDGMCVSGPGCEILLDKTPPEI
jgi:hypothetical protein